jgi:4-amino-4-deoxy-L-arabinose transferase-like glycosyltransferase
MALREKIGMIGASHSWSITAAGVIIVCVFGWLGIQSRTGFLNNEDEFLTAERSRETLLLGPWAVHDNFQVIDVKPPLQYWLTALTLPRFQNRELAVRVWPLIYGALTAVALGWLAFAIDPTRPWLIPISVGLLLSCPLFLRETCRALLDTGLAFFATVAIGFAQLARKRPAWWFVVALVCWLGALQKIPLIILIWLIIVVIRLIGRNGKGSVGSSSLLAAMIAAILAIAIWPLIQMLEFRLSPAALFRIREAIEITWRNASQPYLEIPFRLTTTWPCGGFALVALFLLPFIIKNRVRTAATELSFLCLALIVLSVICNLRSVRYLLPIVPCLCLLLSVFLCWLVERGQAIFRTTFVLVAVLSIAGLPLAQMMITKNRRDYSDQVRIAQYLGAQQAPEKQLVIVEADNGMLAEEFYLFYGNLSFHLANFTVEQIRQSPPAPPMIGVCNTRDLPSVQKQFPNLQIQLAFDKVICWAVDDLSL